MNELINATRLPEAVMSKLIVLEKQKAKIEEERKELHEAILASMIENDVKSIDNEFFRMTRVDSTERESFDSKKFREDFPDLYNGYVRISQTKPSLRMKLK